MNAIVRALAGAVLGAAATFPMNVAFAVGQRVGAIDTLPPLTVVSVVSAHLGARRRRDVAAISHLLVGAAAGSAYLVATPRKRLGVATGILCGILVWIIGYESVMPAAADMPRAHRDRRPRAATILIAHVVFGASLGALARRRR